MKTVYSLLATVLFYSPAFAGDAPTQAAVDPEAMKAKMAEMMKNSQPGEGHKALKDLAGKFNYTLKWWQAPNTQAQEHKGKSTNKWVMGGRFIQQETKAKMKGMDGKEHAFEGVGFTGYDNIRAEYQSIWLDNMATGMMWSTGTIDSATNAVAESGTFGCPMTGDKNMPFRTALKIIDKNNHVFEMYTKAQDGQEFKSMEIAYQRAK